jgi:hypothetical protein
MKSRVKNELGMVNGLKQGMRVEAWKWRNDFAIGLVFYGKSWEDGGSSRGIHGKQETPASESGRYKNGVWMGGPHGEIFSKLGAGRGELRNFVGG